MWGGIFGFLFLIPLRKYVRQWWLRAIIFGETSTHQVILAVPPDHEHAYNVREPSVLTSVQNCKRDLGMDVPLVHAGIVPSLVQMFLVFPFSTPFGIGGIGLGALTPVFVLIFNTIGWGIPAYAWFRLAGDHLISRLGITAQ